MSRFRNSKPKSSRLDISSNKEFPALSISSASVNAPKWNCEKVSAISDSATRYSNGDIFEGDYDADGLPCYGKLTFSGGKIYEGPIQEEWPQDPDDDEDESSPNLYEEDSEDEYFEDEWYEPEPEPPINNYGRMIMPDGSEFWGVFCFPNRQSWSKKSN